MRLNEIFKFSVIKLKDIVTNPEFESELLIEEFTNYKRIDLIINKDKLVTDKEIKIIKEKVDLRVNGYPLQYIIGSTEFMGLIFKVNENVLIPRQDTEILIETILKKINKNKKIRILEIGTGSGAIAISLAYFLKKANITSVDISPKALEVARKNAKLNNVFDKIQFIESDIFKNISGKYDLIVSNPPYIPTEDIIELQKEVKDYEPNLALDGGINGLDIYKRIINKAANYLLKGGFLAFEVGYDQSKKIKSLMENEFFEIEIEKDLPGINRVVIGKKKVV